MSPEHAVIESRFANALEMSVETKKKHKSSDSAESSVRQSLAFQDDCGFSAETNANYIIVKLPQANIDAG